ncbi:MAG: hypothetical protein ACI9X4_000131 [Glaciecola sp.]|jgi:hypothetical protein
MGNVGRLGLVYVLGALCGASTLAQAVDPFAAGTRWTRDASAGSPWMGEEVHFAGRDQFVWGQAGGGAAHQALMRSDSALALVDREASLLSGSALVRRSAAGHRADRVFSLLQTDASNAGQRSTEVHGYAPFNSTRGTDMPPIWSHSMGALSLGEPYLMSDREGSTVVAALWLSGQDAVQVDVLDGTHGSLLSSTTWYGLALNGLQVSADGTRIAIAAGLDLYILNAQGEALYHEAMPSTLSDLALSADGSLVAVAGRAGTRLFEAGSTGYSQVRSIPSHAQSAVAQQTISVEIDLSADGETLAVAQWSFMGGQETAFELWNTETGTRLFRNVQPGGPNGLQNLPTDACITQDGKRAAFAAWGNGSDPEVLLVDRDSASIVNSFDLPGSAYSIDLDETGTRIAVAHKHVHAQSFHSQGAFRLLDSGERGLQALSAARPGHELRIAARHPGAGIVLMLVGQPSQAVQVAGVSGMLLLGRSRIAVRAALADPDGSAQFSIDVPDWWSAPDLPFAVQAAFRLPTGTALTDGILEPINLD